MKHNLEVQDIINCIDNDEYVDVEGIDEWNVNIVGDDAYEIEVNFEDYTQLTISLFRDEYFESRLEKFTRLVNSFWNDEAANEAKICATHSCSECPLYKECYDMRDEVEDDYETMLPDEFIDKYVK